MAMDSYSRVVSWLKILLPLAALALLSTLFLLSRVIDPTSSIPFANTEIQERLRNQQITGPFFSGSSADGDEISFSAERLTTLPDEPGRNQAEKITARLESRSGAKISLQSEIAEVDMPADQTRFTGNVIVTTSQGYEVHTEELLARMSRLDVRSPGRISATGPIGDLDAGQMELIKTAPEAAPQLVFTNGVKLLYQPKQAKD